MNTFLISNDKSIVRTTSSAIVEKSNNIEDIQFIAPMTINEFDLSEFDFVLQYKLPISKEVHIDKLIGEEYKENYLLYKLPTTAKKITSEPGNVEFQIQFLKVELDEDGKQVRYVLNCANKCMLNVIPLENWFVVPDDGLSELADLYLANKALAESLIASARIIEETKADNIKLDLESEDKSIYLTANGSQIGDKIDIKTLNAELTDVGADYSGNIKIINI